MPVVDIKIGQRNFKLKCGEGQEKHLQDLAAQVNSRVDDLAVSLGSNSNETLTLVMTALMLQDEVNESSSSNDNVNAQAEIDTAVTKVVNVVADYVDNLANKLEKR